MNKYRIIFLFIVSFALALTGIYIMSNAIYFTKDIHQLISGFLITIFSGIAILNFTQTLKYHKRKSEKND